MKYEIEIKKITTQKTKILIEASSLEEAGEQAYNAALYDNDWEYDYRDYEYQVIEIVEVDC